MSSSIYGDYIKSVIRTVPDWPQPGVNFRDITPLLQNSAAFRKLIDSFVHRYQELEVDAIAAIDARVTPEALLHLSLEGSVASRQSYGGTAPDRVREQVKAARKALGLDT